MINNEGETFFIVQITNNILIFHYITDTQWLFLKYYIYAILNFK